MALFWMYSWVVTKVNRYNEINKIYYIVESLEGEIRYEVKQDRHGYKSYCFIIKFESDSYEKINELIFKSVSFFEVDKWLKVDEGSFDSAKTLLSDDKLRNPHAVFRRLDRLIRMQSFNYKFRVFYFAKHILLFRFNSAIDDFRWIMLNR